MANKPLQSIKFPGLPDTYTVPQVDNTLTQTGAAADAKKTGDEIADLKSDLEQIVPGLSEDAKEALLACFAHVAWIGTDGQDYYDALSESLNVTVWDYEWKASASSGLPDGMTADSYQYNSSLSALQIDNGKLNFEYLGNCILEVEANAPTSEYAKNDSPSFTCGLAYVGDGKIREAGLWCNKTGGTDNNVWGTIDSDDHAIVDTHIDGTQFHKYRIEVQDGVGSIYVDNSLIGSGYRDSKWAGSARVYASSNLINLRSVKFKMMTDWYEQNVRVFLNGICNATKLVGTTDLDSSALTGDYITYEGETPVAVNRRTLVVKKGITPFTTRSNQPASDYPIPVPKNANKIKVAVTPNTQYSFITLLKLDRTTGKYSSPQSIGGWVQGENVKTFTASEDLFVAINFKYNSSGNTYPTEPTSIVVEFSEV